MAAMYEVDVFVDCCSVCPKSLFRFWFDGESADFFDVECLECFKLFCFDWFAGVVGGRDEDVGFDECHPVVHLLSDSIIKQT